MEFSPLIKGTPDWNEKYNQDIGGLCAEMDAARSSGILNTYVHAKSGTAHTLTGEGAIMRFTATAGWAAGDTISVNGLGKNPVTLEGTALPAGAFAQGTQVVAVVDGENLQFLTQSYAGQFDAISTQMSNKVNYLTPTGPVFDFNEPGLGYGIYRITNAYIREMLNAPPSELAETGRGTLLYFHGSNPVWEQQIFLNQYAGITSQGYIYARTAQDRKGKVWYPWVKIATAEPPKRYSVPYAAGLAPWVWDELATENYYCKTQEGLVIGSIACEKTDGTNMTCCTYITSLPVGFRPKNHLLLPGIFRDVHGAYKGLGALTISRTGGIHCHYGPDGCNKFVASFCFLAEN